MVVAVFTTRRLYLLTLLVIPALIWVLMANMYRYSTFQVNRLQACQHFPAAADAVNRPCVLQGTVRGPVKPGEMLLAPLSQLCGVLVSSRIWHFDQDEQPSEYQKQSIDQPTAKVTQVTENGEAWV